MNFDRAAFFAAYRTAFRTSDRVPKPARLSQSQVNCLLTLLSFIEADTALTDLRCIAYLLATIKHECADTWQPIIERGPKSYFAKYEPNTALGRRLGNKVMGDGYRTRGRGYSMITGLDNYLRMNRLLKLEGTEDDIVRDPDKLLKPAIAYQIISYGMRNGTFTGKRLSDYIGSGAGGAERCDYHNARKIINGLDKAALIAGYAVALESVLRTSLRPQLDTKTEMADNGCFDR